MRNHERRQRSVYVVAGPAGSGKSTLGRALAGTTGGVVLDQDIATNPLMAQLALLVGAGNDLDHPALRGSVRQARYQCLIDVAVDNGRLGRDVVMIAPFTAECTDRNAWLELSRQLAPARVHLIWVTVPPEVALARRIRRNLARDASAATAELPMTTPTPVVDHVPASGTAEPQGEAARLARLVREQLVRQQPAPPGP
jgi:sugar-phosphatase